MMATKIPYDDSHSTDTFSVLYEQHAKAANDLALRLTKNQALAEDAVQEAMLRIWRGVPSLRPGNSRSWFFRIVVRECIRLRASVLRERKRRELANAMWDRCTPISPLESMERKTLISVLAEIMPKLPSTERSLLSMHFENGLSHRKIGQAMAIPQQTVSRRLKNALGDLRVKLTRDN